MPKSRHPLSPAFIVQLTRFSLGSTDLTNPTDRRRLAREVKRARKDTLNYQRQRSYSGPYRIFDTWTPREVEPSKIVNHRYRNPNDKT